MRKGVGITFLVLFILVVFLTAIYFTFFFYYKCDNMKCYIAKQVDCSKTTFINDAEGITWLYRIKGGDKDFCHIDVSVLEVKQGDSNQLKLNGLSMSCSLKRGSLNLPESEISLCHGTLKEELQNLIIKKLHQYILDNVGEIGEKLQTAL